LIATLIVSGISRMVMESLSFSTTLGLIRTKWHPLSTSDETFRGNSGRGPSIKQFQMKCLHLRGAMSVGQPAIKPIMNSKNKVIATTMEEVDSDDGDVVAALMFDK
jgi:hypothetical protein